MTVPSGSGVHGSTDFEGRIGKERVLHEPIKVVIGPLPRVLC